MAKILLTIAALLTLAFIVVAMYCAMVVAGRSNDNGNNGYKNKRDSEIFDEKQICCRCKTGKESYELDEHSESCPYIGCWNDGKCSFYIPLEYSKTSIIKKNERKKSKKQ